MTLIDVFPFFFPHCSGPNRGRTHKYLLRQSQSESRSWSARFEYLDVLKQSYTTRDLRTILLIDDKGCTVNSCVFYTRDADGITKMKRRTDDGSVLLAMTAEIVSKTFSIELMVMNWLRDSPIEFLDNQQLRTPSFSCLINRDKKNIWHDKKMYFSSIVIIISNTSDREPSRSLYFSWLNLLLCLSSPAYRIFPLRRTRSRWLHSFSFFFFSLSLSAFCQKRGRQRKRRRT